MSMRALTASGIPQRSRCASSRFCRRHPVEEAEALLEGPFVPSAAPALREKECAMVTRSVLLMSLLAYLALAAAGCGKSALPPADARQSSETPKPESASI